MEQGKLPKEHYQRMHSILRKNYMSYADTPIPLSALILALRKDKKNKGDMLGLILPIGNKAEIQRVFISPDKYFLSQCEAFILSIGQV